MVPIEIQAVRQWTHSFSPEERKRPAHYTYEPNGALDFNTATQIAESKKILRGFYVTRCDDFVLGDIDHVDTPEDPWNQIPIELVMMFRTAPTYCEASPSGKGIRFIYKLQEGEKAKTTGSYFLLRNDTQEKHNPKEYQVNFDRPWMTITGNKLTWSSDSIGTVTLADLGQAFAIKDQKKKEHDLSCKQPVDAGPPPALSLILTILQSLPVDQNPRIQRAYKSTFNEEYQHYTYWMRVLMAVHNYATLANKDIECLSAVLKWSRLDDAFKSDDDVTYHWSSLSNREDSISYRSLIKLGNSYRLRWPRPKKQTKDEMDRGVPRKPMITEYVNFKTLVAHYHIKLYRDEDNPNILYVTGDADIIARYFMMFDVTETLGEYYGPFTKDTLTPALYILAQDTGFIGVSHNQINQFVKTYLAETLESINIVRLYFDTPFDKLPERYRENAENYNKSTVDYLYEALDIDYRTEERAEEENLYKTYYKLWLMGIVRSLYFKDSPYSNNCVLLLTGPEQIRKTSHFKYLLPTFMRNLVALTTHGFGSEASMRDIVKLSANNLVLVWDEIEQYLTSETESNFKKIIDGNPQKIIDKYEVIDRTIVPKAIYGATSNLSEFRLGNEGSRRLFHIPVKWVDTDHMATVCWHRLINSLKEEMQIGLRMGEIPWLLTKDQLDQQMELHRSLRAKNTLDYALEEIFDFSEKLNISDGGCLKDCTSIQTDKSGILRTTREISDLLVRYGFGSIGLKRPALVKTLERLCGDYTNTRKYAIELSRPKCVVKRGEATQHHFRKWIMPPVRQEILRTLATGFDNVN